MLQSQQEPFKFSSTQRSPWLWRYVRFNLYSSYLTFYPVHGDSWTRCSRGVFDLLELELDSFFSFLKKKQKTPTKLFGQDQSHFIPPCATPPISLQGDKRGRDFIPTEPEQLRVRTVELRFEYSCNWEVFRMLTRQSFYIVPDRHCEEEPQSYTVWSESHRLRVKTVKQRKSQGDEIFRFSTTGLFTRGWF